MRRVNGMQRVQGGEHVQVVFHHHVEESPALPHSCHCRMSCRDLIFSFFCTSIYVFSSRDI
jgi:hypothetical protein